MSTKEFSLDKISQREAIRWIKDAIELQAKKIIVCSSDNHYFPHYPLDDENEDSLINAIICSQQDTFEGVLNVEEIRSKFNPRHFMDKKPEIS